MEHYAEIDVSLELSSVCVVDAQGKIVKEAKVASDIEALLSSKANRKVRLDPRGHAGQKNDYCNSLFAGAFCDVWRRERSGAMRAAGGAGGYSCAG
jgi:hypothetical protein